MIRITLKNEVDGELASRKVETEDEIMEVLNGWRIQAGDTIEIRDEEE